jgi:hypothetical protein
LAHDVIVWDLETVPDLQGFAKANNLVGQSNEEIRLEMGDDFPKLIYHSIVSIGALVATKTDGGIRGSGSRRVACRPARGRREIFCGRLDREHFEYSQRVPKPNFNVTLAIPLSVFKIMKYFTPNDGTT